MPIYTSLSQFFTLYFVIIIRVFGLYLSWRLGFMFFDWSSKCNLAMMVSILLDVQNNTCNFWECCLGLQIVGGIDQILLQEKCYGE